MKGNILELDNVYLEFDPRFVKVDETKENTQEVDEVIFKTTKISKEEILKRLEDAQSLHL